MSEKVYTKVVIDMRTGEVVEEEYFDYSGEFALCDGYPMFEDDGGGEVGDGEEPSVDDPSLDGDDDGEPGDEGDDEGGDDLDGADPKVLVNQIRALKARIEELSELGVSSPQPQQQPAAQYEDVDFISGEDNLDDLLSDPKRLNQVLNSTVQKSIEMVQKSIPQLVQTAVVQQQQMVEMANSFYKENPELKDYKQFVGRVSEKLMSEHPDWGLEKVMEETSKEARRRLQLRQTAKKKDAATGPTRKKGSARRTPAKPDPKMAEIDAMNKALAK